MTFIFSFFLYQMFKSQKSEHLTASSLNPRHWSINSVIHIECLWNSVTLPSGHMTSVLSILERDPPLLPSWTFLPFLSSVKHFFSISWKFFLIRCEVKGQRCRMCTDCEENLEFEILGCKKQTELNWSIQPLTGCVFMFRFLGSCGSGSEARWERLRTRAASRHYVPERGRHRSVSSSQSTAAQKRAEGGRPLVNRLLPPPEKRRDALASSSPGVFLFTLRTESRWIAQASVHSYLLTTKKCETHTHTNINNKSRVMWDFCKLSNVNNQKPRPTLPR